MTTAAGSAARDKLRARIPHRPQVTTLWSLAMAFVFALVVTPIFASEPWLETRPGFSFVADRPAPLTFRVTEFARSNAGGIELHDGGIVVARGELVSRDEAAAIDWVISHRPLRLGHYLAYFLIAFFLSAFYSVHIRRSTPGLRRRTQVVTLGAIAIAALIMKLVLLTTSASVLLAPVAIAAIVPTLVYGRVVGNATGLLAALVLSFVAPFDVGVAMVLLAQAAAAGLVVPERSRSVLRAAALGGLSASAAAALAYAGYRFLSTGSLPLAELRHAEHSAWIASACAGVLSIVVAVPAIPLYQRLVGEITQAQLVAMESLAHPLLRQIAERSPGTWQHSLATANMASLAADAVGADSRLVRVGAYFHDLGKSVTPKYFTENLEAGEVSPHERMAPQESRDAIVAHVTDGMALAQRSRVHPRVIDFMHMHHGDEVLDAWWTKCVEQRNPNGFSIDDFRYPGMPPQTRETAIVAICDEVEVASRKLRKTSATAIDDLVERIVYGKLHLGQLDASGLSMSDLRRISNVLAEIIKQSNRGRVGPVTSHDDDTAETVIGNVVAKPAQFETAKPAVAAVVIPASRGSDLLGVATTLNVAREVPTDSTATQLTETRLIRSKTPAVIVSDGDDLEIVDEIAAPSGSVLVPPVLSPLALAVAGDHAAAHDDVLASPPLTPGETLIGAPPATRAQPTSRVRRKSTVGPTGGSFD